MKNYKKVECDSCYNCMYSNVINRGHILECRHGSTKITLTDKRPHICENWKNTKGAE